MPDHQPITDAITDTPQREAMQPQDTTGEPPAAAQMDGDDAPASDSARATGAEKAGASDGDLRDQLTEDLSVQGGE